MENLAAMNFVEIKVKTPEGEQLLKVDASLDLAEQLKDKLGLVGSIMFGGYAIDGGSCEENGILDGSRISVHQDLQAQIAALRSEIAINEKSVVFTPPGVDNSRVKLNYPGFSFQDEHLQTVLERRSAKPATKKCLSHAYAEDGRDAAISMANQKIAHLDQRFCELEQQLPQLQAETVEVKKAQAEEEEKLAAARVERQAKGDQFKDLEAEVAHAQNEYYRASVWAGYLFKVHEQLTTEAAALTEAIAWYEALAEVVNFDEMPPRPGCLDKHYLQDPPFSGGYRGWRDQLEEYGVHIDPPSEPHLAVLKNELHRVKSNPLSHTDDEYQEVKAKYVAAVAHYNEAVEFFNEALMENLAAKNNLKAVCAAVAAVQGRIHDLEEGIEVCREYIAKAKDGKALVDENAMEIELLLEQFEEMNAEQRSALSALMADINKKAPDPLSPDWIETKAAYDVNKARINLYQGTERWDKAPAALPFQYLGYEPNERPPQRMDIGTWGDHTDSVGVAFLQGQQGSLQEEIEVFASFAREVLEKHPNGIAEDHVSFKSFSERSLLPAAACTALMEQ